VRKNDIRLDEPHQAAKSVVRYVVRPSRILPVLEHETARHSHRPQVIVRADRAGRCAAEIARGGADRIVHFKQRWPKFVLVFDRMVVVSAVQRYRQRQDRRVVKTERIVDAGDVVRNRVLAAKVDRLLLLAANADVYLTIE
jgi:hypothetical protein